MAMPLQQRLCSRTSWCRPVPRAVGTARARRHIAVRAEQQKAVDVQLQTEAESAGGVQEQAAHAGVVPAATQSNGQAQQPVEHAGEAIHGNGTTSLPAELAVSGPAAAAAVVPEGSLGAAVSPGQQLEQQQEHQQPVTLLQELKELLQLAVPISLQNLAGFSLSIIGAVYIGRLGALPLSASVLANSLYNCTGLSITMGLAAGMETLCGQAYGAGRYASVGLVLQRALAVCWTVCLAVAALWAASHPLLLALGQAPEIASAASRYLILCIPCLFISTAMECMKKYLQAQRAVLPAMGAAGVATALSPLIFWYFVIRQGMGLDGAAYAFILCQVLTCAGLLGYVIYRAAKQRGQPQQTWPGWSGAAFQRWPEYLSYGIPAAAMICMEWWAYEVVILMAAPGLLPDPAIALSTMGVCLNINAWAYMLPLGLASAVNTSISNALGAGNAAAAKLIFHGGLVAAVCLQTAIVSCVLAAGPRLVGIFAADPAIVSSCTAVLPLLGCLMFADGIISVGSGVLRGAGRQNLGAGINALGYWAIGIPVSGFLGLKMGLGVPGFWMGVGAGGLLQAIIMLTMISRWDWQKEVERVQGIVAQQGKLTVSYGH